MVLMHMMHKDNPEGLIVAHFDHGIRQNSADDYNFVEREAKKLGLKFIGTHAKLGVNCSEDKARMARYEFLRTCARNNNAKIYTAHHSDDIVESIIINILRGTVADVRSIFNKFSGNLGTTGSLSFLFDHKAVFTFKKKDGLDMDEMILDLIDYGVEDEFDEDEENNEITIYGAPTSFGEIQKHLEAEGFEVTGAEFTYIPNDLKDVTPEERETIDKMVEKLEEFDDVQTVYTNMKPEIPADAE